MVLCRVVTTTLLSDGIKKHVHEYVSRVAVINSQKHQDMFMLQNANMASEKQ